MKKIICLLLSLLLLFSSFSALTVYAEETAPSVLIDEAKDNGKTRYIYYPSNINEVKTVYPVIVWANGTFVTAKFYNNLFNELVKNGFIIVASNDSSSADGTDQIANLDYILSRNKKSGDKFYKRISTTNITAMGHSQGGRSTVNAAAMDGRFACAISIAGCNYVEEAEKLSTPTLFFTGTKDNTVNSAQWVVPEYNACKGPAVYISLIGAGHSDCTTKDPSIYCNYIIKWTNAWNKNNDEDLCAFEKGGELSTDPAWQDYASKDLRTIFKAKATISQTKYVYNGSAKTPSIKVTDSNGNIIPNVNYAITYDSGRKDVGKYKVVVKLKRNFSGTITKTFTIIPKSTTISKLTATSKGFKVTWKKQATQTTGYQIQYSTSSSFSNAKTVTISKNTTTSKTISKLKGKKKYYVRIRTYKTVSGAKYYSSWSAKKYVTTKQ